MHASFEERQKGYTQINSGRQPTEKRKSFQALRSARMQKKSARVEIAKKIKKHETRELEKRGKTFFVILSNLCFHIT